MNISIIKTSQYGLEVFWVVVNGTRYAQFLSEQLARTALIRLQQKTK